MYDFNRPHSSRRGQALIGLIIVMVIILGMSLYFSERGGVYQSATVDARMTACTVYSGQIKAAIMQYKDANNANPPDLKSLKRYGVVDEMISPPCTFGYDPSTGTLYPPGVTPPAPAASSAGDSNSGGGAQDSYSRHGSGPAAPGGNGGVTIGPTDGTPAIHIPGSVTGGGPSNSSGGAGGE